MEDLDDLAWLDCFENPYDIGHHYNMSFSPVVVGPENNDRDRPAGDILLIIDVRIARQENLETSRFSFTQQ